MAQEFIARKGLIALENSQITGSLSVTGTVASSIFSGSFVGDGSQLSGVSAGFPYTGSATISGSLEVTGSVTATSFIGDGSQLTGIADPTPITATINNTNSPFTVTSQSIVIIDSTNGDVTVNLPDLDLIDGTPDQKPILLYKNDYSQNVIYVQPSGSQLVNGTTQDIIVSIQIAIAYNPTSAGWVTEGTSYQSLAELEMFFVPRTETGSLSVATASYVEYANVANKPTLVSGSSQITYSGLTGIPSGIVSGSAQVASFGIFATTGSNQFNGNQAITGSLTVTGQVVAQTLNVQQVTSSIVYSSGSNIFGNSLANTQQFTGSVSVTGSLSVNGTSAVVGTGTTNTLPKFAGSTTIGNSLLTDNGTILAYGNNIISVGASNTSEKYLEFGSSNGAFYVGGTSAEHYIFGQGDKPLRLYTNGTLKATLTSSGNLGLGVTPSAWGTIKALQVFNGSFSGSPNNNIVYQFGNAYYDGSSFRYVASDFAAQYRLNNDGGHAWYIAPSGTAGNAISFTQAMTLDASGRLGIGTTSPQSWTRLEVAGTAGAQIDAAQQVIIAAPTTTVGHGAGLRFNAASGAKEAVGIIGVVNESSGNLGAMTFHTYGGGGNIPERMRITSGGNVLIGTTTTANFGANRTTVQINGADGSGYAMGYNGTIVSYTFASSTGTDIVEARNAYMAFSTHTGERMRIMPSPGEIAFSNNGSSTSLYSQAIATSPGTNYYFNFLESTNNATAASIKVGGILASDSYGIANPDRGDIYAQDNISALSFTDRTPYPSSLELARNVVKSHRRRSEEEIEELVLAAYNKVQNREKEMPQPEKEALTLEEYKAKYRKEYELDHSVLHDYVNDTRYAADGIESRDLSATVSCLVEVVKDLMEKIEALEARIQTLKQ